MCPLQGVHIWHVNYNCGVPQGSLLGLLLFLLYVNDIHLASSALQFNMFVDDTNVFMSDCSLPELINKLNVELAKVGTWFKANKLSLNLGKTNYILFCSKKKLAFAQDYPFSVNLDNQSINHVTSTKFLGVYIDDQLSQRQHITFISSKLAKKYWHHFSNLASHT